MNKQEVQRRALDLAAGLILAALSKGASVQDMLLNCSEQDARSIEAALEAIALQLRKRARDRHIQEMST
jgi:hypothetical protein